ncbi:MAG: hypothetical protein ABI551_16005 [Polyangiaceae bacterium]
MPALHGKLRINETMAYSKEMEALSDALHAELGFGDQTDARFHEYVAREHLDTGMPVVELHRNHGIPLSAVKRWIATFAAEGRAGLEAAAATARAKAIGRDAKLARAKTPPAELDALRHVLSSTDFRVRREAYAVIRKKKLVVLSDEIAELVARAGSPGDGDASVQDELTLLVHLGARDQLHALITAGNRCVLGWRSSLPRFMKDAGCPVRAIEGGR